MFFERSQPLLRLPPRRLAPTVHLRVRGNERSHEPGPHRSLVVSAIPVQRIPRVASFVLWIARRKTPQPVRCQQVLLHGRHHQFRPLSTEHGVGQAHRKNLIRTNTRIWWTAVHHVVQVPTPVSYTHLTLPTSDLV